MKLMIVDDDDQIREGMTYGIQWENFGIEKVLCLKNGKEALENLNREYFDIVITDISMPVMSGIELMREARGKYPDIRFILISGYKEFEYAQAGIQYGADGYILKPIHLNELVDMVSKVIKKIDDQKDNVENQNLIKELTNHQVMRQIIRREITDKEEISRFLYEKWGFSKRHLLLGVILIDDDDTYCMESDNSIKEVFRNKLTEYLAGYTYVMFNIHENEKFLLVDVVDSTLRVFHLKQQLERMFHSINSEIVNFSFSIGGSSPGYVKDLAAMYQQAQCALEDCFFQGKSSCVFYEDYCQKRTVEVFSTAIWNQKILDILEQGTFDEVQNLLNSCEKELKQQKKEFVLEFLFDNLTRISHIYHKNQEEKTSFIMLWEMKTFEESIALWRKKIYEILENYNVTKNYSGEVADALRYIWKHYGEKITVEELAEELHLSSGYFSRIFKKQVGMSIMKYINQYRIQKAENLLKTTKMKIYEVADAVGISDYIYFSQVFRNLTGKSPSDYRK